MKIKTKTILIAAALLATTFSLSACGGGSSDPAPAVTVTETAEAPAPDPIDDTATDTSGVTDEAGLVNAVRAQDSWFDDIPTSQIVETANSFCTALRGGMTIEEFGQVAADTIGQDHAVVLGAGAIVYLCPDQQYKID